MNPMIEEKIKVSVERVMARWESRGKDWLELVMTVSAGNVSFSYRGNGCGGGVDADSYEDAVVRMEAPWGDPKGVGQCTVLRTDRSTLRRIW